MKTPADWAKRAAGSRPLLWAFLAIPGVWLLWAWITGAAVYGEVVTESGRWAAWLLMLALAVTPLRLIFRTGNWLTWGIVKSNDLEIARFPDVLTHQRGRQVPATRIARPASVLPRKQPT